MEAYNKAVGLMENNKLELIENDGLEACNKVIELMENNKPELIENHGLEAYNKVVKLIENNKLGTTEDNKPEATEDNKPELIEINKLEAECPHDQILIDSQKECVDQLSELTKTDYDPNSEVDFDEWFKKAALDDSNVESIIQKINEILDENPEYMEKLYRNLADEGNNYVNFYLGYICDKKGKYEEAIKWYKNSDGPGFKPIYNLSIIYVYKMPEEFVEKTGKHLAKDLLLKLANQSDAEAMYKLGWIYFHFFHNNARTKQWMIKAANMNFYEAINFLGWYYHIVAKDDEKSMEWYLKAHEINNSSSLANNLAIVAEKLGKKEDAGNYYKESADFLIEDDSDEYAINSLSILYFDYSDAKYKMMYCARYRIYPELMDIIKNELSKTELDYEEELLTIVANLDIFEVSKYCEVPIYVRELNMLYNQLY